MNSPSGRKKKSFFWRIFIGFCILLLLTIAAAGFFLKKGIYSDSLTFGSITVSDCALVWGKKLELQIGELSISRMERKSSATSNTNFVRKSIDAGYYLARFFSNFSIGKVTAGGKHFAVDLNQEGPGSHVLALQSDDMKFRSLLSFNRDELNVDIIEAASSRYNSEFKGKLRLHGPDNRLTGTLSALINGSFPVSVDLVADSEQISFEGRENGVITEIRPLVDLFELRHNIQRWITDYLSGSRYHLKSFKGTIPWDNPKAILDTLEVEVRVDDTEYTFAPGLEPIKGRYTDVSFLEGVLLIKPHDATFYGQSGGESWLDIDFNDPKNILLTAYIKTRAAANDDILTLLNYYKINLPFKQVEGLTAADLNLAITLNKLKIEARGIFEIDDGVIAWGGKNYRVEDARIGLTNSDVTIDQLKISYEDILTAQLSGSIHPKIKTGDLDITLEQLNLKRGTSQLIVDPSVPAQMQYHFGPDGHILTAQPTSWLLDSWKMNLGAFRAPVFPADLAIELPPVQLSTPPMISSEISGYFSVKKDQADIKCDLLQYNLKGLELKSPPLAVSITYDQGLFITTEETGQWELSKMPLTLYPSELSYRDSTFTITNSRISYGSFFDSYLDGYYNWHDKKGLFSLEKIDITNQDLEKNLDVGKRADVEVSGAGGKFVINFPMFDLKISTDEKKNWSAFIGDLSKTYSRSKIQQKYKIREGSLVVSSKNGKRPYEITADIIAPYPLLVEEGEPGDDIRIAGQLTDQGVFATLNDDLEIEYTDRNLLITSSRHGYNISAIIELLREIQQSSQQSDKAEIESKPFLLKLKAHSSLIYLNPKSSILADTINMELKDGKLRTELSHGPGKILLQFENGNFLLKGNDLNDAFMSALLKNSRFEGGRMSMSSGGSFEEFSVIFDIKDTNLGKLAALNNVMAFLNTVPALATFSLPEYDQKGLPIDSAVAGIKVKDNAATLESLEILSPELQGKGSGVIDFSTRTIDMDILLKTQAGKNVGKIPLVGYVLAGDSEEASLSIKITGGFDDPKVENSFIEDIIVYPVELLHRTFKLPFHLLEKLGKGLEQKDELSGKSSESSQDNGNN